MLRNTYPAQYDAMAIAQFGSPAQLQLMRFDRPVLAAGEVLINNIASSINPIDYKTRAGLGWAAAKNGDKLPMVLGYDTLGEVIEVAPDVSDFSVGDKVLGFVGFPLEAGCYAQLVKSSAAQLVKLNNGSVNNDLASLPLAGLTAWQGLFDIGNLQAGETVLISGASGGVGYLALQLAINAGANVVAIASLANQALLQEFANVTFVDYNDISSFQAIGDIDLWFDLIGGDTAIKQLAQVGHIKRLVTLPTMSADVVCQSVAAKVESAQGMLVSNNTNQLANLSAMVENNTLRLNIVKYVDFKQAPLMHAQLESGELRGKIVLTF
ncbi:MAG: NADP-dependent oxidoreductase [Psychrobium sp.]|nr:NADP-dependent oxidoreductase [Psychrobium sp.]